jgi:hypothetical protein
LLRRRLKDLADVRNSFMTGHFELNQLFLKLQQSRLNNQNLFTNHALSFAVSIGNSSTVETFVRDT